MQSSIDVDPFDEIADQWRAREDRAFQALLRRRGHGERLTAFLDAVRCDKDVAGDGDPQTDARMIRQAATNLVEGVRDDDELVLLATFIYLQALLIWEDSTDAVTIGTLGEAVGEILVDVASSGDLACCAEAVSALGASLHDQVACENALFCSCPETLASSAVRPAQQARAARSALDAVTAESDVAALAAVLREGAETIATFHEALGRMAHAACEVLVCGSAADVLVDDAIDASERAEGALGADVMASELRAHRFALDRLRTLLAGEQLRLERGRFIYLYPFALADRDASTLLERVLGDSPSRLAGLAAAPAQRARLTGAWRRDVPANQRYDLVEIALDSVELVTINGDVIGPIAPSVTFSSLGNHALRLVLNGSELTPHDIDRLVRRLGDQTGTELVRVCTGDGTHHWSSLLDLAAEIVADVSAFIGTMPRSHHDLPFHWEENASIGAAWSLLPTAHLVIRCDRLAAVAPDGSRRAVLGTELHSIPGAGALLLPLRGRAASIEDWVNYDCPPLNDVTAGLARRGDAMHRTPSTTVIAMPGTPDWMLIGHEEFAIFAASAAGVLSAWGARIAATVAAQSTALTEAVKAGSVDPILSLVEELAIINSQVHGLLAHLKSLNLCTSEGRRIELDRLLQASGFGVFEEGLKEHLATLGAHQALLSAEVNKLIERERAAERRRQERRDRLVQIVGFVLALTGVAGLFDWFNNGFHLDGETGAAVVQLSLLVLCFVLAGWFLWRPEIPWRRTRRR